MYFLAKWRGMAGSGKSTIARSIARRFEEKGELVASLFL